MTSDFPAARVTSRPKAAISEQMMDKAMSVLVTTLLVHNAEGRVVYFTCRPAPWCRRELSTPVSVPRFFGKGTIGRVGSLCLLNCVHVSFWLGETISMVHLMI